MMGFQNKYFFQLYRVFDREIDGSIEGNIAIYSKKKQFSGQILTFGT